MQTAPSSPLREQKPRTLSFVQPSVRERIEQLYGTKVSNAAPFIDKETLVRADSAVGSHSLHASESQLLPSILTQEPLILEETAVPQFTPPDKTFDLIASLRQRIAQLERSRPRPDSVLQQELNDTKKALEKANERIRTLEIELRNVRASILTSQSSSSQTKPVQQKSPQKEVQDKEVQDIWLAPLLQRLTVDRDMKASTSSLLTHYTPEERGL